MERFSRKWFCFLTLALLGASSADAAIYYVRTGGNDAADGRSHDRAWATLDRVNLQPMRTSDRVLLHEGHRFVGQLRVDWSGTSTAPVTIGAYYLSNGQATAGFKAARPTIDGDDRLPSGEHDGLVRVRGDYVHIENLRVVNSEGRAISFADVTNGVVSACVIENAYKSGIKFVNSDRALAVGNIVSRAGQAWPEDAEPWGGAIELVASNDGVVRGNRISEVFGEGINANHGSARSLIEDNYVHAARSAGIYLDAAPDTTVRRNIVIGTTNPEFWRSNDLVGAGIALHNELYHYEDVSPPLARSVQSRRAKIYNNIVAFTNSGIGLWGAELPETSFDGLLIFNNTLVDNGTQLTARSMPKPGAKFLNNILLSVSPGSRDVDTSELAGMTARSNYFSRGNPGGDLAHAGNRYQGLALVRSTGWRLFSAIAPGTWRDFSLANGSAGIGAGDDEPGGLSQGNDRFDLDFNGLPHNVPMDMGALHFTTREIRKPKTPTEVKARP
jgi:hypothetical protein